MSWLQVKYSVEEIAGEQVAVLRSEDGRTWTIGDWQSHQPEFDEAYEYFWYEVDLSGAGTNPSHGLFKPLPQSPLEYRWVAATLFTWQGIPHEIYIREFMEDQ